jgi:phosphotransferase system HPr-like phosphotransfer protein
MTAKVIRLSAEDVAGFVREASACDFDINVAPSEYVRDYVDAKSIVGVMSLNLGRPLIVTYNGTSERFENYLDAHRAG